MLKVIFCYCISVCGNPNNTNNAKKGVLSYIRPCFVNIRNSMTGIVLNKLSAQLPLLDVLLNLLF